MGKKFITLPSKQTICYRIQNQNSKDQQAIVLVHGNFSSHKWWNQTIDGLVDLGKKIVAMDMKGFGQSSYLQKGNRFADYAQNVIDLLDALKIHKAFLVGWSFGGTVSMKICQLRPNLITKLTLTCSVSHGGFQYKDSQGNICKTAEAIKRSQRVAQSLEAVQSKNRQAMRKFYDFILFQKMQSVTQNRKNELIQDAFMQRNYLQVLQAIANSDINIDKIKTPTLVIHGSEDILLPVQTIMGTTSKLGKMDLWQGHGHMIPIEDTPRYIKDIKNFI